MCVINFINLVYDVMTMDAAQWNRINQQFKLLVENKLLGGFDYGLHQQ